MSTPMPYQLKCRECQTTWGNQPVSFCQKCFAPLEVSYDMARIRQSVSKDAIARRATNLWRYKELLPLPENFEASLDQGSETYRQGGLEVLRQWQKFEASLPVGFTPLVKGSGLGDRFHSKSLYIKNDAV